MRILCGTDIIEIERIKKSIERNGENFLNLINGNPKIEFLKVQFEQIKSIDISISHCKEYAVANVTALVDE